MIHFFFERQCSNSCTIHLFDDETKHLRENETNRFILFFVTEEKYFADLPKYSRPVQFVGVKAMQVQILINNERQKSNDVKAYHVIKIKLFQKFISQIFIQIKHLISLYSYLYVNLPFRDSVFFSTNVIKINVTTITLTYQKSN